jgi:hypothetical protein
MGIGKWRSISVSSQCSSGTVRTVTESVAGQRRTRQASTTKDPSKTFKHQTLACDSAGW